MRIIYWVFMDITRNIKYISLFILSFTCSLFMLSMIYTQYNDSISLYNMIESVKGKTVTAFDLTYENENLISHYNTDKIKLKNSYSLIEKNDKTDGKNKFVYLIGDNRIISKYLGLNSLKSNDVFVSSSQNKEEIKKVLLNNYIDINKIYNLKDNIKVLSKTSTYTSLDNKIVIYKEYKDVGILDFSMDEIINSMLIFDTNEQELNNFVEYINENTNYSISYYDYVSRSKSKIYELRQGSIYYLLLFFSILFIFIISFCTNNYIMAEMRKSEYTIHLIYGATRKHIYTRIILYNSFIIGISMILYFLMNEMFKVTFANNFIFILQMGVLSWVLLNSVPIIKIKKQNLFDNLRGDF